MSLSFRKKKNKDKIKAVNTIDISGPVNLKDLRKKYATSGKELSDEEVKAYKARMVEQYEQQLADVREKPLVKPVPDPTKAMDMTQYEKFQQQLVADHNKLRRTTMYAIHIGEETKEEKEEKEQEKEEEGKETKEETKEEKKEEKKEEAVAAPPVETQKEEEKKEPDTTPPPVHEDIAQLPEEIFPEVKELPEEKKKQIEEVEKKINELAEKWNLNYEEIEFAELVASGASGEVHLGYLSGLAVAVKKIHVTSKKERQLVEREYSLLKRVTHPNIIKFLGICDHSSGFYLVTEYVAHGDLFDLLNFSDHTDFTYKIRMYIALQVASACEYLHSIDIIHRDLKSQNVLIADESHLVKLCDFGFATALSSRTKKYQTVCGTDEWLAPEIALEDAYDHKVDIFSYGIVLTELILCKPPRKRKIKDKLAFNVPEFLDVVSSDCPGEFTQLVIACTQFEPDTRPEFKEIVSALEKMMDKTEN